MHFVQQQNAQRKIFRIFIHNECSFLFCFSPLYTFPFHCHLKNRRRRRPIQILQYYSFVLLDGGPDEEKKNTTRKKEVNFVVYWIGLKNFSLFLCHKKKQTNRASHQTLQFSVFVVNVFFFSPFVLGIFFYTFLDS